MPSAVSAFGFVQLFLGRLYEGETLVSKNLPPTPPNLGVCLCGISFQNDTSCIAFFFFFDFLEDACLFKRLRIMYGYGHGFRARITQSFSLVSVL